MLETSFSTSSIDIAIGLPTMELAPVESQAEVPEAEIPSLGYLPVRAIVALEAYAEAA